MDEIRENEARLNVTWAGANGDAVEPVPFDASDADVKTWAAEAVRSGSIPGIPVDPRVDFTDFVVDRFAPTEARPFRMLMIRSKTPFGS